MFDTHTLVLSAKSISYLDSNDNNIDTLIVKWNGEFITIPTDSKVKWRMDTGTREIVIERTDDINTVKVTMAGLVEVDTRIVRIEAEENIVHNYRCH